MLFSVKTESESSPTRFDRNSTSPDSTRSRLGKSQFDTALIAECQCFFTISLAKDRYSGPKILYILLQDRHNCCCCCSSEKRRKMTKSVPMKEGEQYSLCSNLLSLINHKWQIFCVASGVWLLIYH